MRLTDTEVEAEGCDYGVEFPPDGQDPSVVVQCDDVDDARRHVEMFGGKVVVRDVYVTAWAELEGEQ